MRWVLLPLLACAASAFLSPRSAPPWSPRSRACDAAKRLVIASGVIGATAATGGGLRAVGAASSPSPQKRTNEVVRTVNGIKHRRLGGSEVIVSELGLGTQRWYSDDFNAPSEALCMEFLDRAVLQGGVNLVDTAEQYPIPSSPSRPEGSVEQVIGKWFAKNPGARSKTVVATKITGGRAVSAKNIAARLDRSLQRLGTDYVDVYQLHWPARYSPQTNWGQSLMYRHEAETEPYYQGNAGFEEICLAMDAAFKAGKIRAWGLCNDNAFGLTACCEVAKRLGTVPPSSMQNDFSLVDRRSEENGVSEASSPIHENVGFMAYNALAGGYLTGKYSGTPTTYDNPSFAASAATRVKPRGRHDDPSWGRTLYRYRTAAVNRALESYTLLAKQYGISMLELSLRWARERRLVTTVLLGQSSMAQLDEDLNVFRKTDPLPSALLWEIDRVHMRNRLPVFSSDRVGEDWLGEGEIGEMIP